MTLTVTLLNNEYKPWLQKHFSTKKGDNKLEM